MEGERKNNTAMLTVIAIATLLVAVVGATFAYFSASETNTSNVTVSATTASAADVFTSTGNSTIEFEITADKMQHPVSDTVADTDNGTIQVALTAGSSTASCTYDIIYTVGTAFTQSAENTANALEYAMTGACTSSDTTNSPCAAKNFSDTNLKGNGTDGVFTLVSGATIVDSYDDGAQSQTTTTQDWLFTGDFYNLTVSQNDQITNGAFGGNISVTNVVCSNSAS